MHGGEGIILPPLALLGCTFACRSVQSVQDNQNSWIRDRMSTSIAHQELTSAPATGISWLGKMASRSDLRSAIVRKGCGGGVRSGRLI